MAAEPRLVIAFWRPTDPNPEFGQWYIDRPFVLTQDILDLAPESINRMPLCLECPAVIVRLMENRHICAEQFMMAGKALLMGDYESFGRISACRAPRTIKALGGKVAPWDEARWQRYSRDLVTLGSYLKFTQDARLAALLLGTGDALLVEGSSMDRIWGVGLRYDHANIGNPARWRGENALGNCLMAARAAIREGGLPPPFNPPPW